MLKLHGLERTNLATDVAALIRRAITEGQVPSGTRIVESEISRQLGVSRAPVREALRLLESEGLVESRPGRGWYVPEISERDIRELYSLRAILEQEAIKLAVERAEETDIDRLEATLHDLLAAAQEGDRAKVIDLDLQFHRQIWEMADHQRLKEVLQEIGVQVRMYVALQTNLYENLLDGIMDHREILEALRNRDAAKAVVVMRDHLQVATDDLLDYFHSTRERPSDGAEE